MSKFSAALGSIVNVRVAFTDPDNADAAIDPTVVSITVKPPVSAAYTKSYGLDPEVVKESVGNYLIRLTLAEEGTYRWRWTGSTATKAVVVPGSCESTQEHDF